MDDVVCVKVGGFGLRVRRGRQKVMRLLYIYISFREEFKGSPFEPLWFQLKVRTVGDSGGPQRDRQEAHLAKVQQLLHLHQRPQGGKQPRVSDLQRRGPQRRDPPSALRRNLLLQLQGLLPEGTPKDKDAEICVQER